VRCSRRTAQRPADSSRVGPERLVWSRSVALAAAIRPANARQLGDQRPQGGAPPRKRPGSPGAGAATRGCDQSPNMAGGPRDGGVGVACRSADPAGCWGDIGACCAESPPRSAGKEAAGRDLRLRVWPCADRGDHGAAGTMERLPRRAVDRTAVGDKVKSGRRTARVRGRLDAAPQPARSVAGDRVRIRKHRCAGKELGVAAGTCAECPGYSVRAGLGDISRRGQPASVRPDRGGRDDARPPRRAVSIRVAREREQNRGIVASFERPKHWAADGSRKVGPSESCSTLRKAAEAARGILTG